MAAQRPALPAQLDGYVSSAKLLRRQWPSLLRCIRRHDQEEEDEDKRGGKKHRKDRDKDKERDRDLEGDAQGGDAEASKVHAGAEPGKDMEEDQNPADPALPEATHPPSDSEEGQL